jgi:hypothetical protein
MAEIKVNEIARLHFAFVSRRHIPAKFATTIVARITPRRIDAISEAAAAV